MLKIKGFSDGITYLGGLRHTVGCIFSIPATASGVQASSIHPGAPVAGK
jgi:hypothetical protein